MSQTILTGHNLILYAPDADGSWWRVCAAQSGTIAVTTDIQEATKPVNSAWKSNYAGLSSYTVSAGGMCMLADDTFTHRDLMRLVMSRQPLQWDMISNEDPNERYFGTAIINSFQLDSDYQSLQMFSMTATGDGFFDVMFLDKTPANLRQVSSAPAPASTGAIETVSTSWQNGVSTTVYAITGIPALGDSLFIGLKSTTANPYVEFSETFSATDTVTSVLDRIAAKINTTNTQMGSGMTASVNSNLISFTYPNTGGALSDISGYTQTALMLHSFTLAFDMQFPATSFQLQINNGTSNTYMSVATTTPTIILQTGFQYTISVRSNSNGAWSGWSNSITV